MSSDVSSLTPTFNHQPPSFHKGGGWGKGRWAVINTFL